MAAFGRRAAWLMSQFTLFFLAISALSGSSTLSIFWGLLVTIFQRNADIPVRDDITEIDDTRFGVTVLAFFLCMTVLLPFPGGPGAL